MILQTKRGQEFQIDDVDFRLIKGKSCYLSEGYPATKIDGKDVRLHCLFMGKPPLGYEWDHINQDRTDARKTNLRLATRQQNMRNTKAHKDSVSGCKGAHWQSGKWVARIRVDNKEMYLGRFLTLEDAALARKQAEETYWRS